MYCCLYVKCSQSQICRRAQKALKVAFRGSVTVRDFLVDGDSYLVQVPNPLHSNTRSDPKPTVSQVKCISIHRGFYQYLFGTKTKAGASKFDTIMNHLQSLRKVYPNYSIRVTGHSLGGALATLFSYFCAVQYPITCITFASPRVGNIAFVRGISELEERGSLRYLRVVNHKDLVTSLPDRMAYMVCCTNRLYRHAGNELRLYRHSECQIIPTPHHPSCLRLFLHDAALALSNWFWRPFRVLQCCVQDFTAWHSCSEYIMRLQKADVDKANAQHTPHYVMMTVC